LGEADGLESFGTFLIDFELTFTGEGSFMFDFDGYFAFTLANLVILAEVGLAFGILIGSC
jgi:hypothetical protein